MAIGFRKFCNTTLVRAKVNPLMKEIILGHRTGLEDNYFRPQPEEVLDEYLKAVNLLTINEENRLRTQVEELSAKTKDDDFIIKTRLEGKDKEADSFGDLIRMIGDYTLNGIAHQIVAPTLIMDAENDQLLKGQPQLVEKVLTGANTTLVTLTANEGAGEHTHAGALSRAHQTIFDWLDTTLTA